MKADARGFTGGIDESIAAVRAAALMMAITTCVLRDRRARARILGDGHLVVSDQQTAPGVWRRPPEVAS